METGEPRLESETAVIKSSLKADDDKEKSNSVKEFEEGDMRNSSTIDKTPNSTAMFQQSLGGALTSRFFIDSEIEKSFKSNSFKYCPDNPVISIGFHHKQYISVVNANEDGIDKIECALKYNYCKGVRKRFFQREEGLRRIELYGMPFQPYFMDHFTFVNSMMTMLKDLLKAGYAVISIGNLGPGRDMFVWFLQKQPGKTRGKTFQFGMTEILGRCKFRMYGCTQNMEKEFKEVIEQHGHEIADRESKYSLYTALRLDTNVWDTKRSADTLKSKALLSALLRCLEQRKFIAYTSAPLDRKRSTICFWEQKEKQYSNRAPFMLSLMRKNRIVVTGADDETSIFIGKTLKRFWKKVTVEDSMMSGSPDCQTFILDGNPWVEGTMDKFRQVLDLMFGLLGSLRMEGWRASVNIHMIPNSIDRGSLMLTHCDSKKTTLCSVTVEDTDKLRAYKVPEKCIENLNSTILDIVVATKKDWVVPQVEYLWHFEDAIWVSSSSQVWKETDILLEKGHLLLCTMFHSLLEENYHPVIGLNMPPNELRAEKTGSKGSKSSGSQGPETRTVCTFFFAEDDPNPKTRI